MDPRYLKLANILVNYSCQLKKGEKVLIEARGIDVNMINALVEEVYNIGGYPFVQVMEARATRAILKGMTEELASMMAKFDAVRMSEMDAYIGLRGGNNSYEQSDLPSEALRIYEKLYSHKIHHELRVKNTKWVVLRWPSEGMSQLAKMSTEGFEKFYFDVCTLDYSKMDRAMDSLEKLMNLTDKVRITAKDTDLEFSINKIGSKKCAGRCNIPDGEIYSAPVKNSVNGVITYNTPSIYNGTVFEGVKLTFEKGKIIDIATSNNTTKAACSIFDTDEGARFVGEFAIGVNPFITNPMGDILFDEKIAGSIHFTPGCCYDDCYNGNNSAIHWDLVLIQTPKYGGGEIFFDDRLIRKDGRFILPELECLNPENLK
ncbi:MAG: aminopeptidase [Christensenellaceae bacterium]|jgi:aminopeptidase|nr:aminopeptidase [Christensenellaceae bacterium]